MYCTWRPGDQCGSNPVTSCSQAIRRVPPDFGCWASALPTSTSIVKHANNAVRAAERCMVFPPEVALASSHRKCHVLELLPLSLVLVVGARCHPANIRTAEAVKGTYLHDHGLYTGIKHMEQTALEKSPPRRR